MCPATSTSKPAPQVIAFTDPGRSSAPGPVVMSFEDTGAQSQGTSKDMRDFMVRIDAIDQSASDLES